MRFYSSKSITKDVWYVTGVEGGRAFTVELTIEPTEKIIQWAERLIASHMNRIEANEQFDIREEVIA